MSNNDPNQAIANRILTVVTFVDGVLDVGGGGVGVGEVGVPDVGAVLVDRATGRGNVEDATHAEPMIYIFVARMSKYYGLINYFPNISCPQTFQGLWTFY